MFRPTQTLPKVQPYRWFGPIVVLKDPRETERGLFHALWMDKEPVRERKPL